MIGPAAAGGLTHLFGWRSVFLILLPLVAVAVALATPPLRPLTGSEGEHLAPSRTGPALRLAVGAGLAMWAIESLPALPAWLALALGLALAVPGFRTLLPPGVARAQPGLPASVAALGINGRRVLRRRSVRAAVDHDRARRIDAARGRDVDGTTLCWTSGTWIQERLVRRLSYRVLGCTGVALILAGVAGTASVLSELIPVAIAPMRAVGLGIGIAYPTATLVGLEHAPAGREGESSAALQLANVLGTAMGTGVGGGLLALVTATGRSTALGIAAADVFALVVGMLGLAAANGLRAKQPSEQAVTQRRSA
jgi:hypothetical protein